MAIMARDEEQISEQPKGMGKGVILSVLFHGAVVVAALVGLPFLTSEPEEPEEFVMVVNPVIDEMTAAPPPAKKLADEVKPPPAPKDEPEPEPELQPEPQPEPPKPAPELEPKPPEPEPEPAAPEPEPEPARAPEPPKEVAKAEPPPPAPEPAPTPQAKPEPPKQVAKVEPKKEPKPKKEPAPTPEPPKKVEPKTEPPKKQAEPDPFDSLLKTVEELEKKTSSPPPQEQVAEARGSRDSREATSDQVQQAPRLSDIATATDKEAIRAHIQPNWFLDPGMKGISELYVEIRVQVAPDGTVQSARVVSDAPPGTARQFQQFAESARRAVLKSSPIPIPQGKYQQFRDMVLQFRPEDAL